jgi:glycosyltransferase involved in cell wall biosynthesis
MSKWLSKYISIYECPIETIHQPIFDEISMKLEEKQSAHPLVSVVIIAHNEESHILSCLWSLADNVCEYPMEIFIVDNASEDKTSEICRRINAPVLYEEKKSPGYARQCGLDHARGDYYVCIDADTIYPKYYIQTMIDSLQDEDVMVAYGLWSFLPDKDLSTIKLFFFELLRDCFLIIQNFKRPELNVRGMSMAFRIDEARKYGFRKDLIRGEDGSLALSLKQDGKIKMILSRQARPITNNSILKLNGSFRTAMFLRLKKMLRGFFGLFWGKRSYEDNDDNLINKDK